MATVKSDIEIAREAKMKPIMEIGKSLGIPEKDLIPYGHTKAKVHLDYITPFVQEGRQADSCHRHHPTPAGEGKTTTTSAGRRAERIGKRPGVLLNPLGPCFGMKGGRRAAAMPRSFPWKISICIYRRLHAITSAHNLLSAMIDNNLLGQ